MVHSSLSCFILVHWTRLTIKYANYMVSSSFSHFIIVLWTRRTNKFANYVVPSCFPCLILDCLGALCKYA